jgi:hypothetical protein
MLAMHNDGRRVRGQILRPHRGGCREAWAAFTEPELIRIGRLPYPEPAPDIRQWCYAPPCSKQATDEQAAGYRAQQQQANELYRQEKSRARKEQRRDAL